jgi:hypothetical protein
MIKPFKFFQSPFNHEDYDNPPDFRFLGVTPMYINDDGRESRKMIFVYSIDGTIVPAQTIHEDDDAYHRADVYEVLGNQVFLIPRNIELTFNYTRSERF